MRYYPAVCPKCESLILVGTKDVFAICPECEKPISVEESHNKLQEICSRPSNVNNIIANCIRIEKEHGPELPMSVLGRLGWNFPENEEIAFLMVKMGGYKSSDVHSYLQRFAGIKNKPPYAEDLLERGMVVRSMEYAQLFKDYIENKLPKDRRPKYVELLKQMKESYTKTATTAPALGSLYVFYVAAFIINIGATILYMFLRWRMWAYALVTLGIICIQALFMWGHNRIFGNRLKISDTERLLMTLFMASVIIVIGGIFFGAIINI